MEEQEEARLRKTLARVEKFRDRLLAFHEDKWGEEHIAPLYVTARAFEQELTAALEGRED